MAQYYDDLLTLCGFEPEEIEEERPRVEKVFERLGIGPDDMQTADQWVRQNHDVTLQGVRKLLGTWLKQLIDLVLAKDEGKKIVYFGFPAIPGPGLILDASSEDVLVSAPDMVVNHTMGQIFNKLTPILEAGEANGLPPGHSLCSLWQAKIGGIAKGMIPVPDLALASSYFCDMGSKADDLVTALYEVPIAYIDGVMDSKWGEFPKYLPERVHYLGAQIDEALEKAEKVLDINISFDAWEKSQKDTRAFINNLQRLIDLMKANPVPVSAVEIELLEAIPGASTAKGIREGIKALGILVNELEGRVKAGTGVTEKGAPRVMTMVAGHTSDPRVTRLPEDAGLAVASTMLLSWLGGPGSTFKPGENYTTPGERIADYELAAGNFHGTDGAIKLFETGSKVMKLDGLIVNYIYNCRPGGHWSHIPKKYLEEKTGLPVLSLEIDAFDSRAYSADSLRTKVETFAHMLKERKKSA